MTKFIQIDFQNPNIRAFDCFQDIEEAVRYTRKNLESRHNIVLYDPLVTVDHHVYLKVDVPDSYNFSIRNLRGISAYLLKQYPKRYRRYVSGEHRFLVFNNYIPETPGNDALRQIPSIERSNLVIEFIRLLDRVDEDSLRKAKCIKEILEENV